MNIPVMGIDIQTGTKNVTIKNCTFEATYIKSCLIGCEGDIFQSQTKTAIDHGKVSNLWIAGNTFKHAIPGSYPQHWIRTPSGAPSYNTRIVNNDFPGSTSAAIRSKGINSVVAHNRIMDSGKSGMDFDGTNNLIYQNKIQRGSSGGLESVDVIQTIIFDNDFTQSSGTGIYIHYATSFDFRFEKKARDLIIANNIITGHNDLPQFNDEGTGIKLISSTSGFGDILIEDNFLNEYPTGNNGFGIEFISNKPGTGGIIRRNTIVNANDAVVSMGEVTGFTISENTFHTNGQKHVIAETELNEVFNNDSLKNAPDLEPYLTRDPTLTGADEYLIFIDRDTTDKYSRDSILAAASNTTGNITSYAEVPGEYTLLWTDGMSGEQVRQQKILITETPQVLSPPAGFSIYASYIAGLSKLLGDINAVDKPKIVADGILNITTLAQGHQFSVNATEPVSLVVTNALGQKVFRSNSHKSWFSHHNIEPGTYFASLEVEGRLIHSQKLRVK